MLWVGIPLGASERSHCLHPSLGSCVSWSYGAVHVYATFHHMPVADGMLITHLSNPRRSRIDHPQKRGLTFRRPGLSPADSSPSRDLLVRRPWVSRVEHDEHQPLFEIVRNRTHPLRMRCISEQYINNLYPCLTTLVPQGSYRSHVFLLVHTSTASVLYYNQLYFLSSIAS
jgi:hypothetical protein